MFDVVADIDEEEEAVAQADARRTLEEVLEPQNEANIFWIWNPLILKSTQMTMSSASTCYVRRIAGFVACGSLLVAESMPLHCPYWDYM